MFSCNLNFFFRLSNCKRGVRCFWDISSHRKCTPGHIIYRKLSSKLSKSLVPLPGLKVLHKWCPVPQGLESLFSEHQSAAVGDVASQCSAKGPASKLSEENKATEKWYGLFHPDSVSVLQHMQSQAQHRRGIRIFKERGKNVISFSNVLKFHITNVQSPPPRAGLSGRLRSSVCKIMGKNFFLEAFGWKTWRLWWLSWRPSDLNMEYFMYICRFYSWDNIQMILSFQWCIVTKKEWKIKSLFNTKETFRIRSKSPYKWSCINNSKVLFFKAMMEG